MRAIPCVLAMLASSITVTAQAPPDRRAPAAIPHSGGEAGVVFHAVPGGEAQISWVAAEMVFGGKVVEGAPFSAEAVTESTQILHDGNRIVRKSTALVYRDSQGRTRREQTLRGVGPWAADEPFQSTFIDDPVAGVGYILNPRSRTAQMAKTLPRAAMPGRGGGAPAAAMPGKARGPAGETVLPDKGTFTHRLPAQTRTESLGTRVLEGVTAQGTHSTVTIPAGQIGNERPIETVSERWYSPELQTVVFSQRDDPMFGQTVFRLININRSEPAQALFQVPPDYTLKQDQRRPVEFMGRKPVVPK